MADQLVNYLRHVCGAANVRLNEPLSHWTTFRIGGPAKYLVTVPSKESLIKVLSALEFLEEPYFIIGLGANTLASDAGFDGVVLKLNFHEIYATDEFLYADAGAKLGAVVNYARDHGLSGLEWATGIPATIGGAVCMNCGAFDHSMADVIILVDVIDHGVVKTLSANQLKFAYRHSVFMEQPLLIIGAYLRLKPGSAAQITAQMQEIVAKRRHHPHEPSAGSTFKRPRDGFYVGRAIEEAGLKGYQIGGAQVSPQHCGFIVNTGNATCADVIALIRHVQQTVRQKTNTTLEPEIIFLGLGDQPI